jgi:hypothetical protein
MMKTETPETKPTLETLGLTATISPHGVRAMSKDESPMCAWIVTFTSTKTGRSENFDYFTGYGCGPEWRESWLKTNYPTVANTPKHARYSIADKNLMCRISHHFNLVRKWKPDAIEILNAIARDGDALESTFEDWADDFGYDADSRKAESIYRACQENALRLKKILSADKIESIKNLDL